jgi:predicted nucleic acid-binding protein
LEQPFVIVVADSGPLNYLVLIGAVNVLQPLYGRVFVPQSVARELQDERTPTIVRDWVAQPREWFEIRPDPPSDPGLGFLDPGERAAIALALAVDADRLLIDEQAGRTEAERRRLVVTGTLGVLAQAHRAALLDFEAALSRLQGTTFYLSAALVDTIRRKLSER